MTNHDPRPVAADLTDDILFAGMAPEPQPPTDQSNTAVKMALSTLLAANLKPEFGWDLSNAEDLWSVALAPFAPGSVITAASTWLEDEGAEFPTLPEFKTLVASIDRRAAHPAAPEPGTDCTECGEERGWVFATNPLSGGLADRRPCSTCRPEQYEMWQDGHFMPREGTATCHRNHALVPRHQAPRQGQRVTPAESDQWCTDEVIHRGLGWMCCRPRRHTGPHQALAKEHPRDGEDYIMEWSDPERFHANAPRRSASGE